MIVETPSQVDSPFKAEFEAWRNKRPAWRLLLAALRADEKPKELSRLASAAGCAPAELYELRLIRNRARTDQATAARFPAAKKRLEELNAEVAALETKAKAASADEHPGIMGHLADAIAARDLFMRATFIRAEQAARYIELAKETGVF